jgi:hypothetical protein
MGRSLRSWSVENQRILMASAILFPTAATLLACGVLADIQLGGTIGSREYGVEGYGLLLAGSGVALGFVVTLGFRRWFTALALGVSAWMFLLFSFLALRD